MKEKNRLYTGGYILQEKTEKNHFALIDSWADSPDFTIKIRLLFSKVQSKIVQDEHSLSVLLSEEEALVLIDQLNTAQKTIKTLINLDKKGKLKNNAYYDESKIDDNF